MKVFIVIVEFVDIEFFGGDNVRFFMFVFEFIVIYVVFKYEIMVDSFYN